MGLLASKEVREAKKFLAKELKKPLLNGDYAAVYERVLEGLNLLNGLDKEHLFKNKN